VPGAGASCEEVGGRGVNAAVGANDGTGVDGSVVGANDGGAVGVLVGGAAATNVTVSMNHVPGLPSSTVHRIEAVPLAGAVQKPLADCFTAEFVWVRPSASEKDVQASRLCEFAPGANDPVSNEIGEIAKPTKLPPLNVIVY